MIILHLFVSMSTIWLDLYFPIFETFEYFEDNF